MAVKWGAWLGRLGVRNNARELGGSAARGVVVERFSGQIAVRGTYGCEQRPGRLNTRVMESSRALGTSGHDISGGPRLITT